LSGKDYHGKDKPNNNCSNLQQLAKARKGKSSTGAHSTQSDEVILLVGFLNFISRLL
jgi:hypothetical protein